MPRVVPFDGDGSGGAADQDSIFNVPAFFILFRETLEAAIILCIVLNILNRTIRDNAELLRRAKRHVWIGTAVGLGISLAIAIAFIAVFYTIKSNLWEDAEPLWEGILGLIAT
ncbi:iron permease FTR1, partial [Ramicandelaber brevisporus]